MSTAPKVPRNQWTGPAPIEQRLFPRIDASGDCWIWTGHRNNRGYGVIGVGRGKQYVHRLVYELLVGPIPAGLQLDHLCRVRACANPDHLEPVTPRENGMRGYAPSMVAARTNRCRRGLHDLVEGNLYYQASGRLCKACRDARRRAEYSTRASA